MTNERNYIQRNTYIYIYEKEFNCKLYEKECNWKLKEKKNREEIVMTAFYFYCHRLAIAGGFIEGELATLFMPERSNIATSSGIVSFWQKDKQVFVF